MLLCINAAATQSTYQLMHAHRQTLLSSNPKALEMELRHTGTDRRQCALRHTDTEVMCTQT
eukprot:m.516261 g.516261  ORF g.516261 m.516261 type:complete len:61 (+) comp21927_c3_seq16:47-229(+)